MQIKAFSLGARLCAILHDSFSTVGQNLFLPAKSKSNIPMDSSVEVCFGLYMTTKHR